MSRNKQFPLEDEILNQSHLGKSIKLSDSLMNLIEVEKYLVKKFKEKKIKYCYDCTGNEDLYFNTINYTTYGGCIILHPLQFEVSLRQMHEARISTLKEKNEIYDWCKYFKERIESKIANKYEDRIPVNVNTDDLSLVVLPGENRIKKNICIKKLSYILENEKNPLFKPHPVTSDNIIRELKDRVLQTEKDVILDKNSNLYEILPLAEKVYTTYISESAAYAIALDKKINPIDAYQVRFNNSGFMHINHGFFVDPSPKDYLNETFSSYKSGIIHPDIHSDWKKRIDNYLDYIFEVRDTYENMFLINHTKGR